MDPILGIQQLQLGKALTSEKEAMRVLLEVKNAGFSHLELNGFMIRKTPTIAKLLLSMSGMSIGKSQSFDWDRLLTDSGLGIISIHEDLDTLEERPDFVYREVEKCSPRYVVVTGMYRFPYDSEEAIGDLIVRLNRIGRNLSKRGVGFLYHNHSAEFQSVYEGVKAYDLLIDGLNPEWVNFEFDSFWAVGGGADPIYWMDRLDKRMRLYHVCDRGNRSHGPYLTPILKSDATELGKGNMNLPALLTKVKEIGVDAIILEQSRNYVSKDPVASLRISGEYLRSELPKLG